MRANLMRKDNRRSRRSIPGHTGMWLVMALALFMVPIATQAQVSMVGTLGNFDVLNDTGRETHGFEVQVEGISSADIYRIFGYWGGVNVIRYGQGTATDYPGGVYIRWTSTWDPNTLTYSQSTPVPTSLKTAPAESCWTGGMGNAYYSAGCEHFGISSYHNPTNATYHWLVADPQNPGSLMPYGGGVSIPAPTWTVMPPAQVGNPPVVVAEIVAPPAPEPVLQFGDAQWVKVYKTELAREVQVEELVGDNPAVVPEDAAHLEVSWNLIQRDPQQGKQKRKGRQVNQGNLGDGSHAVIRRYEYYKYAGAYDPLTHEALCGGDGSCTAPLDGELGDAIGVQNVAVNVAVPSLTLTTTGNGNVSSGDKVFSCGNKCFGSYALDTAVTLTAIPGSGSVFVGWGGACSGSQLTCTVNVNDVLTATATFAPQFTLSIGRSGSGTVTGTPSGNDRSINCGSTCSAKFIQGTTVTLMAIPATGLRFTGWTGACSGTSLTCNLTIGRDTQAQANFAK